MKKTRSSDNTVFSLEAEFDIWYIEEVNAFNPPFLVFFNDKLHSEHASKGAALEAILEATETTHVEKIA